MKKLLLPKWAQFLLIFSLVLWSCEEEAQMDQEIEDDLMTIVETAQGNEDLESLVAALLKADENEDSDLVGTLSAAGPFTVFAPTDEAFTALLESLDGFDSLDDFDDDSKRALLANILQYHVVAGAAVASTDLTDGQEITTVLGETLTVDLNGGVFINDDSGTPSQVVIPDVEASNGIVHVINKVLLPQSVLDALSGEADEEETSQNLVEIVVEAEALSVLEAAVIKAGLAETLSGDGPFTVMAPTDAAFLALLDILGDDYNSLDDFDTEEELALLTNILLYHVVPAKVLSTDLAPGMVGTAYAGNDFEVISSGDTFVLGDASGVNANLLDTDILATNGVAHVIDKVLLPQAAIDFVASLAMKNIVELAIETDDLSLLVDALIQADAGLVEALSGEGPFTVFAPTNAAFGDLLHALGDDFNSLSDFDTEEDKALLVKVLTYHVVSGAGVLSSQLSDGQMVETLQGENLTVSLDGGVFIQDATEDAAEVVMADVEASNGVVHIINKVLLPQEVLDILNPPAPNIVQLAQSSEDLSLLVDALVKVDAGLVEALSGEGPFTVFAPTNAAFAALLDTLGDDYNSLEDFDTEAEINVLIDILTYHVVAGVAAKSTDLSNHQELVTLQGESLFAILNHGVFIRDKTDTDATVGPADLEASNGVVHIVDKVLLPQSALDALFPPSH